MSCCYDKLVSVSHYKIFFISDKEVMPHTMIMELHRQQQEDMNLTQGLEDMLIMVYIFNVFSLVYCLMAAGILVV